MSRTFNPVLARAVIWTLAVAFSSAARADDSIPLAHKYHFVSCDSAIKEEMESYEHSSSGRINVNFNDELPDRMITLTVTFGVPGDSVLSTVTFMHEGTACWSVKTSMITTAKQCMQYKEENPAWKYVETQADVTWTVNAGGVNALLKSLPNGGCVITWPSITHKYPASGPAGPSRSAGGPTPGGASKVPVH